MANSAEVYIAGPLFNSEENSHNIRLASMFREAGYTVFNPIEDGIEGASQETEETQLLIDIFSKDRKHIKEAIIFVANLNGPQVDDGTAAEIGMAFEIQQFKSEHQLSEGIEVMIGYFNDTRSLSINMRRNPMVQAPFMYEPNTIVRTREEALDYSLAHFPPRSHTIT
jgi:hypothetical protein